MPSQEQDATATFTLSFGGVDFCLEPGLSSSSDDAYGPVMSVGKICSGGVSIDLNGFVGTLRVKVRDASNADVGANDNVAAPTTTAECRSISNNDEDETTIEVPSHGGMTAELEDTSSRIVEDTPSPNKKCGTEQEVVAETKSKQSKGQQKLNFFGSSGNKHGRQSKAEKIVRPTKRAGVDPKASTRKKSRVSSDAGRDVPTPDTAAFNDFIEELDSDCGNNESTLASLGQTMPDCESSLDGDGIPSDAKTKANDDVAESRPGNTPPRPRWGQTMTMIDHRRFIVYGGQTIDNGEPRPLADLFVYDLMDGTWTRPINCDGVARTWHTANFLPERQLLLCFGGEVLNETTGKLTTTDQVMVLDTEIMLWYPPTVSGQIPSGRSGHGSCFLPDTNELVVFGGVKNGRWLNSAYILDTNRWRWSALKAVGDAPRPRSYHSATVIGSNGPSSDVGSRVVIFGGNDGDQCFNSVHVLEATGEGKKWVWTNPKCNGDAPSPRTGHVAALLNDGSTIMIYGGWDPNTEVENGHDLIFGDSHLLDTKTWTWTPGPRPRYEKSGASNGGADRVGHSAVLAPGGEHGVQVLAFGGRVRGGEFVGDFQSLVA